MKFGKNLRDKTLKEWRFYAVDYKDLKKTLKDDGEAKPDEKAFFECLEESERKLSKFYHDKEKWAISYMSTLEERVASLREVSPGESATVSASESVSSMSSNEETRDNTSEVDVSSEDTKITIAPELEEAFKKLTKRQSFGTEQSLLKVSSTFSVTFAASSDTLSSCVYLFNLKRMSTVAWGHPSTSRLLFMRKNRWRLSTENSPFARFFGSEQNRFLEDFEEIR